ncbi:zinc finger, CCHC-type containing protein [Tanacetum coccineum]
MKMIRWAFGESHLSKGSPEDLLLVVGLKETERSQANGCIGEELGGVRSADGGGRVIARGVCGGVRRGVYSEMTLWYLRIKNQTLKADTVDLLIDTLTKGDCARIRGNGDSDGKRRLLLTHQEWSERYKKKTEGESKSKSNRGGFGGSRGQGRGRGRSNGGRGTRGRGGSHYHKDGGRGSSSSQDKSKIQCYNCQEYGHYAAECTNPRRERSHENNLIREENEPALLLSALEDKGEVFLNEENVNPRLKTGNGVVDQSKLWYLDTGASNHMTGDKKSFCKNGEHRKLQEVYYIPDLCSNIISLGQLSECGDEIKIKEPFLWVRDKTGRLLMKVQRSPNRLYKIELEEVRSTCLIAQISDPTWLWHARLGHLNFGALKTMSDKNMVEGMPKLYVPTQPCEGCLVGKQTRHSFPAHTNYRATKRLELIHGDLCGPISPPTPSVVERRNRTVVEMVRSNLKTMCMPDVLWGEAVNHAVYVLNRVTSKALKDSTPYEMWTGRKAHLGHLRVFGCVAHMRIVQSHLKKLDNRSMKLVHLGIEKGSKAYRLLDPDTGKLYVSRDVIFEEDQVWGWEKSTKVKATPGMSFTIEGFNTDEFYDDDFEPEPDSPQSDQIASQSDSDWTEQGPEPINPPVSPASPVTPNVTINSPSTASSSTGGGAPKRYRLLTDLYDETEEIDELMMIRNDEEPVSYTEASKKREWVEAMDAELSSIEKNKTWTLVDLPKNRKAIDLKWVYKGYVQKRGVDYDEVFAPVARIETKKKYMIRQPEDKYLKSLGFVRCAQEYSVYTKKKDDDVLIIGVYVDDLIVTGSCHKSIQDFKRDMKAKFEMSDLGLLSYYLGIEVNQQETGITLKQEAYARSILTKTRMIKCNPNKRPMEHKLKLTKDGEGELINPTEYRSIVGGLRYLTHTRPDISFAVGVVSRFMEKPTEQHLQAVKGILRYVKGTLDHGLLYTRGESKVTITGYSDSDLANDVNDRKSTGGMAFYVNGNLVTGHLKSSELVALIDM